jgi:hypothetical protein
MLRLVSVFILLTQSACQYLAPVDAPINSCHLVNSSPQSGGLMPQEIEEFSQCEYRCPDGQIKLRTQFGQCAAFIGN